MNEPQPEHVTTSGRMRVALIAPTGSLPDAHLMTAEEFCRRVGGNTGNLAFIEAIRSHLPGARIFPWHADPAELREHADVLVLAAANQIGPHTDLTALTELFEATALPVVVLGLGAQSHSIEADTEIPAAALRWLKVVADLAPSSAPNVGLRGYYTLRQLERVGAGGNATVIGCPSNFLNLDPNLPALIASRRTEPVRRIAVSVGQPYWPYLMEIERGLIDLADATYGFCVAQSELLMVQLAHAEFRSISAADFGLLRQYFRPALSSDEFAMWSRRNMLAFGNAETWRRWLRECDFVVGTRLHGVMLGLQSGVPAGCVTHDSRMVELCETMGVPSRHFTDMPETPTLSSLPELFAFDGDAYRRRRSELAGAYVDLLRGCGLQFDPGLEAISQGCPAD